MQTIITRLGAGVVQRKLARRLAQRKGQGAATEHPAQVHEAAEQKDGAQAGALASAPDPHTSAHQAAHVVQQRGGVQLKGGVGEADDSDE